MEISHPVLAASCFSAALLFGGYAAAQQPGAAPGTYAPQPQPFSNMYGSMGNVYSPYYRQFQFPGMLGMPGMGRLPGTYGMSAPGYFYGPQSGMYGSMGNLYHPYYRQFQPPGMGGMYGM
jgi:hypothetical protein